MTLVASVAEQRGFKDAFELFESVQFKSGDSQSGINDAPLATMCCNLLMGGALDAGDKQSAIKVLRTMQHMSIPQDDTTAAMLDALKMDSPPDGGFTGGSNEHQSKSSAGSTVVVAIAVLMALVSGLFVASEAGISMLNDKKRGPGSSERETLAAEYSWTENEIKAERWVRSSDWVSN